MSSSSGPTPSSGGGGQTLVSTAPPEPPKKVVLPRRNGWNCPWHPFQGIAWFFVFFFALAYFGFLVFYIPGPYITIAIVVREGKKKL